MILQRNGFTLFELLAVLVITGITAAMAAPALSQTIHHWHLKTAVQDIYQGFHLAKTSAALRHTVVALVFDQNSVGVSVGFTVFSDLDADLRHDEEERVIKQVRWKNHPGISVAHEQGGEEKLSFPCNADKHPAVGFRPNGIPVSNTGGLGMGSIILENRYGLRLGVILSCAGRLRIAEE